MSSPYRTNAPMPSSGDGMFGNYNKAKHRKAPPWAAPVLGAAVVFHIVLFLTMWVKTIWDIEQLEKPKTSIDLAVAPPPPPPPPPPPGGAKPHDVVITPKKRTVKDIVQPVKIEKQEAKQTTEQVGVEGGEEGGVEGGVVGGDVNGVAGAPPPPPPPPPPPAPPQNVAPATLEASRIAGNKNIEPTDVTKTEIQRSGKSKVIGSFKLCLSLEGVISAVSMLKSTGFPAYDQTIMSRMRAEWRYRPFMVNGKAVPVCTAVTFIYSQT
jgi:protein TonB